MLVLKALPLLLPLFGILRGQRYTHQWASLLVLAYITEGIVRTASDSEPSRWFALMELIMALTFFFSCIAYARVTALNRSVKI